MIAVLLSGGRGTRMGDSTPKQYLLLNGIPIILYSFVKLLECESITQLVVVCAEEDHDYFNLRESSLYQLSCLTDDPIHLLERIEIVSFAESGARRQDSLQNALEKIEDPDALILIHDGVRPFINTSKLQELIELSKTGVAAALGTRTISTIKTVSLENDVIRTIPRDSLWMMNTPQIVPHHILLKAYDRAENENIHLTDDLSFAELAGYPCKIVEDHPYNLKITHPFDLEIAELILQKMSLCTATPS